MKQKLRSQIFFLYLLICLFGYSAAIGYVYVLMNQATLTPLLVTYLTGAFIVLGSINLFFLWWLLRPIKRAQDFLSENPQGKLEEKLVRSILSMDMKVFFFLSIQLLVFLLPVVVYISGWSPDAAQQVVLIAGVASLMQGIVGYYGFNLYQRAYISPEIFKYHTMSTLIDKEPSKTWRHIAVLIFLLGVVLPVSVFVIFTSPTPRVLLTQFLFAHFLLVGLLVGWAVLRAVFRPVEELYTLMAEVAEGKLDVHANIHAIDTMGGLCDHFNAMVDGLRQREHIRNVFGRYVSTQVAEVILEGELQLGGEKKTATVLFTDIRGFTSLSEQMPPEEVVSLLNQYFDVMVRCMSEYGGTVDKFIGDAILCLFGVPIDKGTVAENAFSAIECAKDMRARLAKLNEERKKEGLIEISSGIGIHTGLVIAGNIGTSERMEYTVIGDTVNLCSRLEHMTKDIGTPVLISEATAKLVEDKTELKELSTIEVRGREEAVKVFGLV